VTGGCFGSRETAARRGFAGREVLAFALSALRLSADATRIERYTLEAAIKHSARERLRLVFKRRITVFIGNPPGKGRKATRAVKLLMMESNC
jgi:hypothetical protein